MAGDIYEVTAEGQYYALTGNKKDIKNYVVKFKADDTVKKQGFLSAFRNALAPKDGQHTNLHRMMMEQYPDYKRFRTHQITEVVNLSQENKPVKELTLMNRAQIVRFIDTRGLPIDTDLYPSVTDLRQALTDYRENPEIFARQQEKRRQTKGTELAVMRALDTLNDPAYKTPAQKQKTKVSPPILGEDDEIEIPGFRDHTDNTDYDDTGIPEFDKEDELDALIAGV